MDEGTYLSGRKSDKVLFVYYSMPDRDDLNQE